MVGTIHCCSVTQLLLLCCFGRQCTCVRECKSQELLFSESKPHFWMVRMIVRFTRVFIYLQKWFRNVSHFCCSVWPPHLDTSCNLPPTVFCGTFFWHFGYLHTCCPFTSSEATYLLATYYSLLHTLWEDPNDTTNEGSSSSSYKKCGLTQVLVFHCRHYLWYGLQYLQ